MNLLFTWLKKNPFHPFNVLAFVILLPLPFFYFLTQFFSAMQEYDTMDSHVERLHYKAQALEKYKKKETALLEETSHPDHYYIDKQLETLVFMEPEIKKLQALCAQTDPDDPSRKRLAFLKEGGNKLLFSEGEIRKSNQMQEMEEKQQNPVEMDQEDLKKLLSLVEGISVGPYVPKMNRPQMVIKNFEISKKNLSSEECAYVVNMQLIKRESLVQE